MAELDIVYRAAAPLRPYERPEDFVVEYTGLLRRHAGPGQPPTRVGRFRLYRVLLGLAVAYGHRPFDVFDAHSDKLCRYYAALFDPETGTVRGAAGRRPHSGGADLLLLDALILEPPWRGLRLGLLAVRRLLDLLGGSCGLVACRPVPLGDADAAGGRQAGKAKLRRHLRRLGFRRVGRTGYYGLAPAGPAPRFEDLLRGTG
jgi:hypothetical protein